MPFNNSADTRDIVTRWPYDFQEISVGDPHYKYLSAYAVELDKIDTFIDELYEQQFLQTATGRELEKLAAGVSITRQEGESDPSLRYRAQLGKVVAASDGTPKDIEAILEIAFGEDNLNAINVSHKSGAPVIQFEMPSEYINDIPLTRAELEDELESAFPASHGVEVVLSDTWLLGRSGSQGIGNGGLV